MVFSNLYVDCINGHPKCYSRIIGVSFPYHRYRSCNSRGQTAKLLERMRLYCSSWVLLIHQSKRYLNLHPNHHRLLEMDLHNWFHYYLFFNWCSINVSYVQAKSKQKFRPSWNRDGPQDICVTGRRRGVKEDK